MAKREVTLKRRFCHGCRLDYRRKNKAEEWEDKFSERKIADDKRFCSGCRTWRTWWWFCYLPITADEIARFLARSDKRRMAEQNPPVQLED